VAPLRKKTPGSFTAENDIDPKVPDGSPLGKGRWFESTIRN
jgi:hypothetical protein